MAALMKEQGLLIVMTAMFATLALDIAVPALVLSAMAASRWLVLPGVQPGS